MLDLKFVCPIDTLYDDADEEEIIQLILTMQEEDQPQTKSVAQSSMK